MTEFVEVKTADLDGAALDWAVAKAEGHNSMLMPMGRSDYAVGVISSIEGNQAAGFACNYSTDWSQGGPIMQKHLIEFTVEHESLIFACAVDANGMPRVNDEVYGCFGPDYLVAGCRALVLTLSGETVSVPKELV